MLLFAVSMRVRPLNLETPKVTEEVEAPLKKVLVPGQEAGAGETGVSRPEFCLERSEKILASLQTWAKHGQKQVAKHVG